MAFPDLDHKIATAQSPTRDRCRQRNLNSNASSQVDFLVDFFNFKQARRLRKVLDSFPKKKRRVPCKSGNVLFTPGQFARCPALSETLRIVRSKESLSFASRHEENMSFLYLNSGLTCIPMLGVDNRMTSSSRTKWRLFSASTCKEKPFLFYFHTTKSFKKYE